MANFLKTLIGLVMLLGLIATGEAQRIYRGPIRGHLRSGRRFLRAVNPTHHHSPYGRGETLVYTNSYGHHAYPRHKYAYASAAGIYAGTRWANHPIRFATGIHTPTRLSPILRGYSTRRPGVSTNSTAQPMATNSTVIMNGPTTETPVSSAVVTTTIATVNSSQTESVNMVSTTGPEVQTSTVNASMYSPVEPLAENSSVTISPSAMYTTNDTIGVPANEPEVVVQPTSTSSPVVLAAAENTNIAPEQPAPSTTAPHIDSSPTGNDALDLEPDSSAPFNEIE